ncbi:conserved hypothetical protein [delta proteobacterium NaphS2]|nr:conserved hypothetical protein [delta proteobacterium NaphS2]
MEEICFMDYISANHVCSKLEKAANRFRARILGTSSRKIKALCA